MSGERCAVVVVDLEGEGEEFLGREGVVVCEVELVGLGGLLALLPEEVVGASVLGGDGLDEYFAVVQIDHFVVFITHL
jgi:hypothetical protein